MKKTNSQDHEIDDPVQSKLHFRITNYLWPHVGREYISEIGAEQNIRVLINFMTSITVSVIK